MEKHLYLKNQSGQALALAVIAVTLVLVNSLILIKWSSIFHLSSQYTVQSSEAIHLAEAGVDKAIASFNATGGSYNGESNTKIGNGEVTVTITNKDTNTKVIKSTSYVPSQEAPKSTKTITLEIARGIGAAFNYGLQVGDGGLVMAFNSHIEGSIYSNGNIQMGLNNEITGDAYVAGGVQPTPDQETNCMDPDCTDSFFGKNVSGQNHKSIAQSFQPSEDGLLRKVSLGLAKHGSPSNITVRIMQDNNGSPDRYQVISSEALPANLVTENYGLIDIAFSTPANLNAGTTYWIMLDANISSSNYWLWQTSTTNIYNDGQAKWSTNWQTAGWNGITGDLTFKTYMGGSPTYIDGALAGRVRGNVHANTIKNLSINGSAYYQVISSSNAHDYYPNSPDPGVAPMPLSDSNIQEWKNLALSAGSYDGNITNCPASLPAGKYNGTIHPPDNCTILVDTPIWFTGDITLGYNTTIKLQPSYGASSGVMISDGIINLFWKDVITGSGTSGSYMILLSTFDSKNDPGQRAAINLTFKENSGIVYAGRGAINIGWGNRLTSVTGWKLILGSDTRIDYDEGLAGAFFSSGPSGSYSIIKGTYQLK